MAFEDLLSKLGPTLVREATPHFVQLVGNLSERFRKDTREIKAAVDAEMTSVARTHAGLATAIDDQRTHLNTLRDQITVVDRKVELLHRAVESLTRQLDSNAAAAAAAQRVNRRLVLCAALCSGLSFVAVLTLLVLHR